MPKRQSRGPARQTLKGVKQANVSLGSIMNQMGSVLEQVTSGSQAQKESGSNQSDAKILMSLKIQQAQLELQKDQVSFLKRISDSQNKQVEALTRGNKDWKTFGDKFKDMKRGLSDAMNPDTIKKAMLGPFSMFKGAREKIEDINYAKRMKALGSTKDPKELKEDSKKQRAAKVEVLRQQEGVNRLKKMGATDDQIANSKELAQRNAALKTYNSYNQVSNSGKSAKDAANTMGGNTSFKSAPLVPAENAPLTDLPTAVTNEAQTEQMRIWTTMADNLVMIAANTSVMAGKDQEGNKKQARGGKGGDGIGSMISAGADMLGNVMGFFSSSFFSAIRSIFSVKSLLKVISKVFAPAMLVGALVNGIMDGFNEWKDTGSFSKALIAGMGGILDFLTFGLLDKNTIRNVADNVKGFVNKYLMNPIYNFIDGIGSMFNQYIANPIKTAFGKMMEWGQNMFDLVNDFLITPISNAIKPIKDFFADAIGSVMNFLKGITIPGIAFKVPLYGDVAFGPWHPFNKTDAKSADNVAQAQAPKPTSANNVSTASKANADNAAKKSGGGAIVNAPKTSIQTNNNQTNVVKQSARNSESSFAKYLATRY